MTQISIKKLSLYVGAFLVVSSLSAGLTIVPETFDFGWCPDNAKVSAEFMVKNDGGEIIPLTSVQPTCGCTAPNFTPGNLAANESTKVGLTFNTRGYRGIPFNKSAKVKTDSSGTEYTVYLKGVVMDPQAKVAPDGDGIASFEPDTKDKRKAISIKNSSEEPVTLDIVQKTADWANVKLSESTIKPGASVTATITVDGSYSEPRTTSVTYDVKGSSVTQRLTLAVRTGPAMPPLRPPVPPAMPVPSGTVVNPIGVKPVNAPPPNAPVSPASPNAKD